jgi:hypothetical protein
VRIFGPPKTFALLLGASLLLPVLPAAAQKLSNEQKTIHLLQRTTFGVRPEDVSAVLKLGREKWLDRQLNPGKIDDKAVATRLEKFPVLGADMGDMVSDFQQAQMQRRELQRQREMGADSAMAVRRPRQTRRRPPRAGRGEVTRSVYSSASSKR